MNVFLRALSLSALMLLTPFLAKAQTCGGGTTVRCEAAFLLDGTEIKADGTISGSGMGDLPLGDAGAAVPANISLTTSPRLAGRGKRNVLRVRTRSAAFDPNEFDGQVLPLESTWDLDFNLSITPINEPFGQGLGDSLVLGPEEPLGLELSEDGSFVFAADKPGFGLLSPAARRYTLGRRRRNSLIDRTTSALTTPPPAPSFGGMSVELEQVTLIEAPGPGVIEELPGGLLRQTYDITLSLEGTLNGQPFLISDLVSTVVQTSTLSVTVVPEPTAIGILALAAAFAPRRSRRR